MFDLPAIPARKTASARRSALEELARRKASTSLESFVRMAWPLLNPGVPLCWAPWMTDLCLHLEALREGKLFRTMVANYPPGCSKTTICSICWPVWSWGQDGGTSRWWFGTWSELNGRDQQKQRRDLLLSSLFALVFAPKWRLKDDSNSVKWFKTTALGWYRHTTPLSRDATGAHGDYFVMDDVVPASAAFTDEALIVRQWWVGTMESRVRNRLTTRKLYVGQRICTLDLCELWRDNGEVDCNFVLPAEGDPSLAYPPTPLGFVDRRAMGEPLFPARFPPEVLESIKTSIPSAVWMAQHQQRPGAGEAMRFPAESLRRWSTLPSRKADEYIGAFDTAGGQSIAEARKKDPDWNVGQVWGRWGDDFYLVAQLRNRSEFAVFESEALAFIMAHPEAKHWVIEGRSTGSPLKSSLSSRLLRMWREGEIPQAMGQPPSLERKPVQSNKEARIFASTVHYEHGHVYVPGEALAEFKAEAMAWPKGRFDDQIDCAAAALDSFTPRGGHSKASASYLRAGIKG